MARDLIASLPEPSRKRAERSRQPDWLPPMLATLTHQHFSSDGWIYERKLDGERCLAFCAGRDVRLLSRNRQRLNETYPELVDILTDREHDGVFDGEVVAFEKGRTSFSRLQRRMGIHNAELGRRSGVAVSYYVFDLLHLDGHDVRRVPLRDRKTLLRSALTFRAPLHLTTHRNREGEAFLLQACRWQWEGLIAKRADSEYAPKRSTDWLKFRCSNEQEFVVAGFTDPMRSRVGFGALLLGYYEKSNLVYAGKVGTGFDTATLLSLQTRLSRLEVAQAAFARPARVRERGVHWVRPELVAQVAFTEWTGDGLLRHPRFLGLRDDKAARDVVRERPRDVLP